MSEFICSICEYKSDRKYNVDMHISSTCTDAEILIIPINIRCDFCDKQFSTYSNLKRHVKNCKIKKLNQEEEIKKLKEELAIANALAKKPNNIVNNTQNNTQNNNINITLSPWNNPKLPPNIEEYYKQAIKKVFMAVPTLVKLIHFNEEHPENHNICIRNARNGLAKVFNGKDWETVNEDEVIRSLIYDYEESLDNYAAEHDPSYIEKMNKIKLRDTEEKVYDDMHIEIKRAVHDRNKLIKIR